MSLKQALIILKAHWKLAVCTLLTVFAIGTAITLLAPKQYTASTKIVFDVKSPDPVIGQMLPSQPGYIATQVEIISSERVAQRVVKMLQLDQSPTVRADWMKDTGGKGKIEAWLGELMQKKLTVYASRESSMVQIGYSSPDPVFATVVANAFAQAYLDANIELRVDPARQYARWFGDQGKTLRDNLEQAQTKLSEFQQEHGIVAKDQLLDVENTALAELSSKLTTTQAETADAQSKQRSNADSLPEAMKNSVIAGLQADIARQEGKLQEAAGNLGPNHPQYLRMQSELAALKQQLSEENQRVTRAYSSARSVSRGKEADLRIAIAAQEKKLLQNRFLRDQLAVLQRDVDAAQSAYDAVTKRYNQTALESQMTQANASVLSPATEPTEPSFPNFRKGILISLLAGILLAGAIVFVVELLDRRVRGVDDLVQMLQVPLLGVIQGPRGKRRVPFFNRHQAAPALE